MLYGNDVIKLLTLSNIYFATNDISPTFSPTDNVTGFNNAVSKCSPYDVLFIPSYGGQSVFFNTEISFGQLPTVNKPLYILIEANCYGTYFEEKLNPPFLFKIFADNVVIDCNNIGTLNGNPNYIFDGNTTENGLVYPALIYNTGKNFIVKNTKLVNYPKCGVLNIGGSNTIYDNLTFAGGTLSYNSNKSGLFGIREENTIGTSINNLFFLKDSGNGGNAIQGVFSGGYFGKATGLTLNNAKGYLCEKVCYLYTDNSYVSNVVMDGNLNTEAVRTIGDNNTIVNIKSINTNGIVGAFGSNTNVSDIFGYNIRQAGVVFGNYASDNTDIANVNLNNINVFGTGNDTLEATLGVFNANGDNINITNVNSLNMGKVLDRAYVKVTCENNSKRINAVTINNVSVGDTPRDVIILNRSLNHVVNNVSAGVVSGYLFKEIGSDYGNYTNGYAISATSGINGRGLNTKGKNNCYSKAGTEFTVTLQTSQPNTVVNSLNPAPEATITFVPISDAASLSVVANGNLRYSISGNNITLMFATGNNAPNFTTFVGYLNQ